MEDRDGKKPFTIPKTHTSTKDVLISEKTDSRNVTELFDDLKSCALEVRFNFRQNECKSCDTIRNQKLQKLYNEKRLQMKKDQDPIERFAFHLIKSRDVALNIATDGLMCDQLVFSIDKYLGNPKDGIHLSRRPDVLLASSGAQGLCKFGLLICKVLLGKGYTTIPSVNNNKLSAQLHYDHHFCKIQSLPKEQRHIDDLLANSLIFCYEHDDFQTLSRPSQILPIAILWYDLNEKFSSELVPIIKESQQRNGKNNKTGISYKKKTPTKSITSIPPKPTTPSIPSKPTTPSIPSKPTTPLLPSSTTIALENLAKVSSLIANAQTTPTKYPTQFMFPYPRVNSYPTLYTSFSNEQQSLPTRDSRLPRTTVSSETIPLSAQKSTLERSQSDASSSTTQTNNTQTLPLISIPLNSTIPLIDPRLKTLKELRNIFYLETNAVKHALQQQKRLNNYYDFKNGSMPKTSYTLIPFSIHTISSNEYVKTSFHTDYSSLYISVIDCFNFGFTKTSNEGFIDLEEDENKLAYEQIKISNQLIQHEKQLSSQEIRLRLREKRQRKIQEQLYEQKKNDLSNSKIYINNGRKLLKEHQLPTIAASANNQMSADLLDFFSQEYRQENRPHVKRILAELLGVFVEKYGIEQEQIIAKDTQNKQIEVEVPVVNDQTINTIIDMDLESPSSQGLCDFDERFRARTPPPPPTETISNQPLAQPVFNESNNKLCQHTPIELPFSTAFSTTAKSASSLSIDNPILKANHEQIESSSNENSIIVDNRSSTINDDSQQTIIPNLSTDIEDKSNRSRDEFVKLLTKEAYVSKPPSPSKVLNHRRRSYDNNESNTNKKISSTRTVTLISNNQDENLIIETTADIDQHSDEEPTVKRTKVDLNSSSSSNDNTNSLVTITDDRDYRQDLDDRRRQIEMNDKSSLHSHSRSTNSHNSSMKQSKLRSPSVNNRYRQQRNEYQHERKRTSNLSYHYPQQNINNLNSPEKQSTHHQRFNYNHQSVADHPRFANVDTIPSPSKNLNYNSFSTYSYPNSRTDYQNTSPVTMRNQNHSSSYYNESNSDYQFYQDNYSNNLPKPPPLMSALPATNFSNSYDLKPSNTIERLQMFLQNKTGASYEHGQTSTTDYSSSSYTMNSPINNNNNNNSRWSSSRYSSAGTSDATNQNKQSFTYNDAEQLLTFVQRSRN